MEGRYASAWTDTIAALQEVRERRSTEVSYRRLLRLTDQVLGRLERLNLAGRRELDAPTRRAIAGMLAQLGPATRGRLQGPLTVQQGLDAVFEVQAELLMVLQRLRHWDGLVAAPWDGAVAGGDERPVRRSA